MTQLVVYDEKEFELIQRYASAFVKSGFFKDTTDIAKAVVKIQAGKELGLQPFASMKGIHIIHGQPSLGANVMAMLIKQHPRYNYKILEISAKVCSIEFYEDGEAIGISEFTAQEAQQAGTQNMNKFPKNMLFARALSNGARWFTPDIFGGAPMYTPEELGANVDSDGEIIDITPRAVEQKEAPQEPVILEAVFEEEFEDGEIVATIEVDEVKEDDQQEVAQKESAEEAPEQDEKDNGSKPDEKLEAANLAEELGGKIVYEENDRMSDIDTSIWESDSVQDWIKLNLEAIPRYSVTQAIQGALKKIGYENGLNDVPMITGRDKVEANITEKRKTRLKMSREIRAYAAERDAEETK